MAPSPAAGDPDGGGKSPPRRGDGAGSSCQDFDSALVPGSGLPYRARNGTCKVELRARLKRCRGRQDSRKPHALSGGRAWGSENMLANVTEEKPNTVRRPKPSLASHERANG